MRPILDERSERNIATLHPTVRDRIAVFIAAAKSLAAPRKLDVRVISGFRSYAEQDEIFAQGRTRPGRIVSNARAGHSTHNFGIAVDIGIFQGKEYLGDHPLYDELGPLGESLGLEWGGRWKKIKDTPHYQFRPAWAGSLSESEMLASLRSRVEKRIDILA